MWFYTIVNLLLVKLVFWIIIDTFRELRERKQKLEREIRTQCFICGIRKQEFELRYLKKKLFFVISYFVIIILKKIKLMVKK